MKKQKWIPKINGYYWEIGMVGVKLTVEKRVREEFEEDDSGFEFNCFKTKKIAKEKLLKIEKILKED